MPPPRTVPELIDHVAAGGRVEYLYFWGHRPTGTGEPGPSCLSQWWPAAFPKQDRVFATAEHWMMWSKARLFGDDETAERILAAGTPAEAKTLGAQVRAFDGATWQTHRYGIVLEGSVAKFAHHPELEAYLLGTGDRVLVEASPHDRIWGIGLTADDPRAADPTTWRGLNLLGFALMDARRALLRARSAGRDAPVTPAK